MENMNMHRVTVVWFAEYTTDYTRDRGVKIMFELFERDGFDLYSYNLVPGDKDKGTIDIELNFTDKGDAIAFVLKYGRGNEFASYVYDRMGATLNGQI
jgi:hypothetical protein